MTKSFFIIVIVFFVFTSCATQEDKEKTPKVEKGTIDLRKWNFNDDGLVKLDGEWEFYWKELLNPADIDNPEKQLKKEYIRVPENWKGKIINGEKIKQFGYATYRLKVLLGKNAPGQYSFSVMYIPTACKIFVNGELISKHGIVGTSSKEAKPGFITEIIDFNTKADTLDVVIQVSNFQFYKAGLAYVIKLGEVGISNRNRTISFGFELFFLGAILIMAIFFIGFYVFRPIDKSSLYFGIFSLLITIYLFFVGLPHILFFDELSFDFQTNIIRYTAYFLPVFLILFFKEIFPEESRKWMIYLIGSISTLFILLTLILPITLSSPLMIYFRYLFIVVSVYLAYILILATIRKRDGAKILLIGFSFLFLSVINDILYHAQIIESSNLLGVGLFFFIASLSFYLSFRFAISFNQKEKLAKALNHANENLEKIIEERIQEISQQKEEITTQAGQLKSANDKLVELDKFKESMVQMLVHDLKNPLSVIYSLPDMLEPGDDLSLIKRAGSQMLNLVTNMLDVQKYENSKMELDLELVFLNEIVEEAIKQTNFLSVGNKIVIVNSISKELKLKLDKKIIERVLINLLSNAVKFTPMNGKINVGASIEKNKLKVFVKDSGIGIEHDMLDSIFDKFAQIIAKDSGEARSTGLGLSFCKLAVESHGGRIWAESPKGQGAVFYFTLPV